MLDVCNATVNELHGEYAAGRLTVREAAFCFLRRIAARDAGEDGLNSVLEINPDVLFLADALDGRLQAGETPKGLFGIPVLLKANINTADSMRTTAGSVALADLFAPHDAAIVARLREAGALLLGKANMTEFANYMSNGRMPAGYSSLGGQVVNPHRRDETPGGSSSGSAVAVAAGLCTLSVGTETSGSILHPAMKNGIVGIKPTMGLLSRTGILPISRTHDVPGPMARSVLDAANLLTALAGPDPRDPATGAFAQSGRIDYAAELGGDIRGMRIGINRLYVDQKDEEASAEQIAAFEHLCDALRDLGADLIEGIELPRYKQIGVIMRHEFRCCLDGYLASVRGHTAMTSLGDIIQYNQQNAAVALRYGQGTLIECQNEYSGNLTEGKYLDALSHLDGEMRRADALLAKRGVEVLLCAAFTNAHAYLGLPALSLPLGKRADGLPIGSHWIGRRYGEQSLLRAAYAAERALDVERTLPI